MRRVFLKEEEAPVRLSPAVSEDSQAAVEPRRATPQVAPARRRDRNSAVRGRLLKGTIVAFSSLGALSLLMPALTGISTGEVLQSFNLKSAYSLPHLTYLRASSALKLGNLAGATDGLLSLPKDTTESRELVMALFPKLLEAREYGRAAQVLQYIQPEGAGQGASMSIGQLEVNPSEAFTTAELGKHMGAELGLERSMALIAGDTNLTLLRDRLLEPIFVVAAAKELPALEKLTPTLHPRERNRAAMAVLYTHLEAKRWDAAWQATTLFAYPQEQRSARQQLLTRLAQREPLQALERLTTLQNTFEYAHWQLAVFSGLAGYHLPEAKQLLQQLSSPALKDRAIGILLTRQAETVSLPTVEEILELLDKQSDPQIKAQTLVQLNLAVSQTKQRSSEEFLKSEVAPRLYALARQHAELIPLNDQYMLERIGVNSDKELRASYLKLIQNPITRAVVAKEMQSSQFFVKYRTRMEVLTKARNSRFSDFESPE